MTVDLNKSTFTAEEAVELTQRGYEMIEVATANSPTCWIIGYLPQPRWCAANDLIPVVDMSINLPDGAYTMPSGGKENKDPSW